MPAIAQKIIPHQNLTLISLIKKLHLSISKTSRLKGDLICSFPVTSLLKAINSLYSCISTVIQFHHDCLMSSLGIAERKKPDSSTKISTFRCLP